MTRLSGFALNEDIWLKLLATICLSMPLHCLLVHSDASHIRFSHTANFKVTLCPSRFLPLTWFCLALDGSGCRRSDSCQRTALGWWLPGPSAEPLPHGWGQKHLWQYACRITKRTTWDRETRFVLKVFFFYLMGSQEMHRYWRGQRFKLEKLLKCIWQPEIMNVNSQNRWLLH